MFVVRQLFTGSLSNWVAAIWGRILPTLSYRGRPRLVQNNQVDSTLLSTMIGWAYHRSKPVGRWNFPGHLDWYRGGPATTEFKIMLNNSEIELSAFHWTWDCCLSPWGDHEVGQPSDVANTGEQRWDLNKRGLLCYITGHWMSPHWSPFPIRWANHLLHWLIWFESSIPRNLKNAYCFVEIITFDQFFSWVTKGSEVTPGTHIEERVQLCCLWIRVVSISFQEWEVKMEPEKDWKQQKD